MIYTNFTDEELFENPSANIIGNKVFTSILTAFEDDKPLEKFCVTGSVAKHIQRSTSSQIKVLSFITSSTIMFDIFKNQLPIDLRVSNVIAFRNQIQIESKPLLIECFLTSSTLNIEIVDGFYVQSFSDIPNYIN